MFRDFILAFYLTMCAGSVLIHGMALIYARRYNRFLLKSGAKYHEDFVPGGLPGAIVGLALLVVFSFMPIFNFILVLSGIRHFDSLYACMEKLVEDNFIPETLPKNKGE